MHVFGYIDLAELLITGITVLIVSYQYIQHPEVSPTLTSRQQKERRYDKAAIAKENLRHAKYVKPLIITVVGAGILIAILIAVRTITAEQIKIPNSPPIETNKIDAALCQRAPLLQCAFPNVNCADFTRLPNGMWHSGPTATLTYPTRPGSFANNTFGLRGIVINGIDLAEYLRPKMRWWRFAIAREHPRGPFSRAPISQRHPEF